MLYDRTPDKLDYKELIDLIDFIRPVSNRDRPQVYGDQIDDEEWDKRFMYADRVYRAYYETLDIDQLGHIAFICYATTHEAWKVVYASGMKSVYTISSFGRISNTSTKFVGKGRKTSGDYMTADIRTLDLSHHNISMHQLVARHFIPNPFGKLEVNHIDFNVKNNRLDNLEWVTSSENKQWSIQNGRQVVGEAHKNHKCTDEQIHKACKLLEDPFMPITEISRITGVSKRTLKHIIEGHGWPHIAKFYNIPSMEERISLSPESRILNEYLNKGFSNKEIIREVRNQGLFPELSNKKIKGRLEHLRRVRNI